MSSDEQVDRNYLLAAHELTEALHRWMVRWVQGHVDDDRYACGAPDLVDEIMGDLLIRDAQLAVTASDGADTRTVTVNPGEGYGHSDIRETPPGVKPLIRE